MDILECETTPKMADRATRSLAATAAEHGYFAIFALHSGNKQAGVRNKGHKADAGGSQWISVVARNLQDLLGLARKPLFVTQTKLE